jgi:hypothetical protein
MEVRPGYTKTTNKDLIAFEEEVDTLFPDLRIIASCTYPITESGAEELLDVARAHRFVLTRRREAWEFLETRELMQGRVELKKLNEDLEPIVIVLSCRKLFGNAKALTETGRLAS